MPLNVITLIKSQVLYNNQMIKVVKLVVTQNHYFLRLIMELCQFDQLIK
jgi:hypothetical protein